MCGREWLQQTGISTSISKINFKQHKKLEKKWTIRKQSSLCSKGFSYNYSLTWANATVWKGKNQKTFTIGTFLKSMSWIQELLLWMEGFLFALGLIPNFAEKFPFPDVTFSALAHTLCYSFSRRPQPQYCRGKKRSQGSSQTFLKISATNKWTKTKKKRQILDLPRNSSEVWSKQCSHSWE